MKKIIHYFLIGGMAIIFFITQGRAQEEGIQTLQVPKDTYLIGEEKTLEIIVHIWGEVRVTGEKRVPDGTNILELISKAGGPTEYSDLSHVMLFRDTGNRFTQHEQTELEKLPQKYILEDRQKLAQAGKVEINLKNYLNNDASDYLPRLIPGDVIHVKRNVWFKWQTFIRVASQIAIIAQVWYWYSRIE